jgi:anti-anti-sigma regulatory factor
VIRFGSTDNGSTTIISVAGGLEADHLAELQSHCAKARHNVVFDLAQLQSADEASTRWLCDRVKQGCRVTGASPYIKLRLERGRDGS